MDGTSRTILVSSGLPSPVGITIDYASQVLYWVDYYSRKLEKANTDGTGRHVLVNGILYPYHITYYHGRLYWGSVYYDRVSYTDVSSPNGGLFLSDTVSYGVYGIQVIAEDIQLPSMSAS